MPQLKLLKGKASWSVYTLGLQREVIGRDPGQASVVLADDTSTISRRHAEIVPDGDRYFIVDYSRYGTNLNNGRLIKGVRYPLTGNDLIQMCNYVVTFLDDEDDSSTPSEESVHLSDDDSSSFSHVLDLSSGSWATRKGVNPEAKLSAIMAVTRSLQHCKSLEELLGRALDSLLKVFTQAYRGVVVLQASTSQMSPTKVARYRDGEDEQTAIISTAMIEDIAVRRAAALVENELTICASLLDDKDQSLGIILLDSRSETGRFSKADLDLLATVAVELAIAVENRILHEAALRERKLQLELKVANEVQIGLLPAEPPRIEGYDFFEYYSAARQVGGDYYDYIERDRRHLAIALGDVAGKGIPAALLMARVASELSVFLANGLAPAAALQCVNVRFEHRNPQGRFVTMVLGVLDHQAHEMVLANAGHMLPLFSQAGGTVTGVGSVEVGLPLGVDLDYQYAEFRIAIQPGETLVFYSDGVTDARNASGEFYGVDRLRTVLSHSSNSATEIGQRILDDIHAFVGNAQQFDDICLLCVGRSAKETRPSDE